MLIDEAMAAWGPSAVRGGFHALEIEGGLGSGLLSTLNQVLVL